MNRIDLPASVRTYNVKQRLQRALKGGCVGWGIVSGGLLVLAILNAKITVTISDIIGILVIGIPVFVFVSNALFIRYMISTTLIRIVESRRDEQSGSYEKT